MGRGAASVLSGELVGDIAAGGKYCDVSEVAAEVGDAIYSA